MGPVRVASIRHPRSSMTVSLCCVFACLVCFIVLLRKSAIGGGASYVHRRALLEIDPSLVLANPSSLGSVAGLVASTLCNGKFLPTLLKTSLLNCSGLPRCWLDAVQVMASLISGRCRVEGEGEGLNRRVHSLFEPFISSSFLWREADQTRHLTVCSKPHNDGAGCTPGTTIQAWRVCCHRTLFQIAPPALKLNVYRKSLSISFSVQILNQTWRAVCSFWTSRISESLHTQLICNKDFNHNHV